MIAPGPAPAADGTGAAGNHATLPLAGASPLPGTEDDTGARLTPWPGRATRAPGARSAFGFADHTGRPARGRSSSTRWSPLSRLRRDLPWQGSSPGPPRHGRQRSVAPTVTCATRLPAGRPPARRRPAHSRRPRGGRPVAGRRSDRRRRVARPTNPAPFTGTSSRGRTGAPESRSERLLVGHEGVVEGALTGSSRSGFVGTRPLRPRTPPNTMVGAPRRATRARRGRVDFPGSPARYSGYAAKP